MALGCPPARTPAETYHYSLFLVTLTWCIVGLSMRASCYRLITTPTKKRKGTSTTNPSLTDSDKLKLKLMFAFRNDLHKVAGKILEGPGSLHGAIRWRYTSTSLCFNIIQKELGRELHMAHFLKTHMFCHRRTPQKGSLPKKRPACHQLATRLPRACQLLAKRLLSIAAAKARHKSPHCGLFLLPFCLSALLL